MIDWRTRLLAEGCTPATKTAASNWASCYIAELQERGSEIRFRSRPIGDCNGPEDDELSKLGRRFYDAILEGKTASALAIADLMDDRVLAIKRQPA